MDVHRLRSVLDAVAADNELFEMGSLLKALDTTFSQSIQTPTADTAESLAEAIESIRSASEIGQTAALSENRLDLLREIGGEDFAGPGLLAAVNRAFSAGPSPANIVQALGTLRKGANTFYDHVSELRSRLEALSIEPANSPADEAEIEIRIPAPLYGGSLNGFAKESAMLDKHLSVIVEFASGSRPPLEIRGLDSGSVQLYLSIDHESGVVLVKAIADIVKTYITVQSIRAMRKDAAARAAPATVADPLATWENESATTGLTKVRDGILALSKLDKGRKNELKAALLNAIFWLAKQIDKGLNIDVTTAIPPRTGGDDDGQSDHEIVDATPKQVAADAARVAINSARGAVRSLTREAEPILRLGPGYDDTDTPEPEEQTPEPEKPKAKKR